jgi:Flp pilus assembly protein TadG
MRLHRQLVRGRARLLAFRRDDHGGIAIIASAFFMVGITCSALAIDVGSLYLEKRNAQSITDLAAMAAAGDLAHAEAAARATLVANKIDIAAATVKVDLGHYDPKLATAVSARFTAGALPYNAARVTVTKPGRIFFAKTFVDDCCTMTVTAMSANAPAGRFERWRHQRVAGWSTWRQHQPVADGLQRAGLGKCRAIRFRQGAFDGAGADRRVV